MPETLKPDELVEKLRDLVDNQEGGDAVVLLQRQLFNRVVGRLSALQSDLERVTAERDAMDKENHEVLADYRKHYKRADKAEAALVKARAALTAEVISLIEDDMYGPGEAGDNPERIAFNRACRRQINRITSRLIVAPELAAARALSDGEEDNGR